MGRLRATTLLLAVLAAGLLLSACGSSGNGELLPGTTADQINANLDTVRESAENGACEKAEVTVAEVSDEVDELTKVNQKLKAALAQGAEKLSEAVSTTCGQAEEEAEEKKAEETEAEEQEQLEAQEEEQAEEEVFEQEEDEKQEEKAKEKAEKEAEQPEPPTGGEESEGNGKAKGHEKQEEETVEPESGEIEVTPPGNGGSAGGIGPGASVEGEG